MNWYLQVIKQYANFEGRARRKEYWMFVLINTIISYALLYSVVLLGSTGTIAYYAYSLLVLIPSIAVGIRRLHDTGKSGWWLLISLTIIGIVWLLILLCQDSEEETNEYGENPKAAIFA